MEEQSIGFDNMGLEGSTCYSDPKTNEEYRVGILNNGILYFCKNGRFLVMAEVQKLYGYLEKRLEDAELQKEIR